MTPKQQARMENLANHYATGFGKSSFPDTFEEKAFTAGYAAAIIDQEDVCWLLYALIEISGKFGPTTVKGFNEKIANEALESFYNKHQEWGE